MTRIDIYPSTSNLFSSFKEFELFDHTLSNQIKVKDTGVSNPLTRKTNGDERFCRTG